MADIICPLGHQVPDAAVQFDADGRNPRCPVCTSLGVTTTNDAAWRYAGGQPPGPRSTSSDGWSAALILLGLVAGGFGLASFFNNTDAHHLCQSSVLVAGSSPAACRAVAWHYYGGIAGAVVGVALVVWGIVRVR